MKASPLASEALVPQPHGGALRRGGTNRGGPGAPPSLLREKLRGSFADRIRVIESIADGRPMQTVGVRIMDIAPHVACPNCGELGVVPKDLASAVVEVQLPASASPKDRIASIDLLAKYGLGQLKEISVESVRERVGKTLEVIREHVSPDLYQAMLPQLKAQWS